MGNNRNTHKAPKAAALGHAPTRHKSRRPLSCRDGDAPLPSPALSGGSSTPCRAPAPHPYPTSAVPDANPERSHGRPARCILRSSSGGLRLGRKCQHCTKSTCGTRAFAQDAPRPDLHGGRSGKPSRRTSRSSLSAGYCPRRLRNPNALWASSTRRICTARCRTLHRPAYAQGYRRTIRSGDRNQPRPRGGLARAKHTDNSRSRTFGT